MKFIVIVALLALSFAAGMHYNTPEVKTQAATATAQGKAAAKQAARDALAKAQAELSDKR